MKMTRTPARPAPAARALCRRLACIALLLAVAACGGGADEAPPAGAGVVASPAGVGVDGGTVPGPDGAQVEVPPGALTALTPITIERAGNGAPPLPAGFSAFGEMFAFTPHGSRFALPVTVTLPVDAARVPAGAAPVLYQTDGSGGWVSVSGAQVGSASVSAQVSSFSWFVLGNLPPVIAPGGQPADAALVEPDSARFSVTALGTPPLRYQWQRSDDGGASYADIAGANAASLLVPTTSRQDDDGDRFRVVVSNLEGRVVSAAARLAVSSAAPPPAGTASLAAGSDFSLASSAAGALYSWGADNAGTLGAGPGNQSRHAPAPVAMPALRSLAAGGSHALAVLANGELRAWGYNGFGQLGIDAGPSRESPVAPSLPLTDAQQACGGTLHSLVRRADGSVRAFGANHFGQLGDGSHSDRPLGVAVSGIAAALAIACRGNHSLALLADGSVWSWGANDSGQLGDGSATARALPVPVTGLTQVTAIAAGLDHSLALRSDGTLWAWGSNLNGMLGTGSSNSSGSRVPVQVSLPGRIVAVAAGAMHSVALRDDGTVLAWGINETGQLGSGSLSPGFRATPVAVAGLPGPVRAIAAGGGLGHTLALLTDGRVFAWGDNQAGQLGIDSRTTPFSATPTAVPGLNLN